MSSRGKTWTKARAVCPRPGHAGSHVRFDGHYGKPGHRRQLYRCVPNNGDAPHRFAEKLPREESWLATCDVCERPVRSHEGPHSRAKRMRSDPATRDERKTRHGSLVMDWVEVFAPVVFEPHRPNE